MTGIQFADILRDASMLSGGAPELAWVRAWKTARGIPLGVCAEEAATAADPDGRVSVWLQCCARGFHGRYTVGAAEFVQVMQDAADCLRASGACLFPSAVGEARGARTFAAWSAAAYAGGLRASEHAQAEEPDFLAWLRAMCARYVQE